jgi:hypothetical protein
MNFNISTMAAAEHRAQLIREADTWRRRREARKAARARTAVEQAPATAYCRRAAAQVLRGAT